MDASAVGILMRSAQKFSMRYPLTEVEGSCGTQIESGDHAAPRYTSTRLSELSNYLFQDIKKNTITEWRDNYDNTEQYPSVVPSKGFYNIVNGSLGIATGASASIPQFNLKEVNNALIKLMWNSDIQFDEIYCAPDFATGGVLLNEEEVKESLKNGKGKACKLRSVIEYDEKERCFIVKEIPYSVYTNTICGELESIEEDIANPGIERHNDLTGKTVYIKIYLKKGANPSKVLKYLYKNTSLQSFYGINMTMLENGRFPRVFGWKECLEAFLSHQYEVYYNGYKYDLEKIKARLHIIEGLIIAVENIDEVVALIKSSASTSAAAAKLKQRFNLDDEQVKAILDIKLSKLANLEIEKIRAEQDSLLSEKSRIEAIIDDSVLLKKEIEKDLTAVAEKFGDARRTQILNIEKEGEEEPIEEKAIQISLTNNGVIYAKETSSLLVQKRGGVGAKLKLKKNDYVNTTITARTTSKILFFTNLGNLYHMSAAELTLGEQTFIQSLFEMEENEIVCAMSALDNSTPRDSCVIIFTKNGYIKKTLLSEYNLKRNKKSKAINLQTNDSIVNAVFSRGDKVGILTHKGYFLTFDSNDVNAIGKDTQGVKAISLTPKDWVVCAQAILPETQTLCFISEKGYCKQVDLSEFPLQKRATRGKSAQNCADEDAMIWYTPIIGSSLIITSSTAAIKIELDSIPKQSRAASGNRSIKLGPNDKVLKIQSI